MPNGIPARAGSPVRAVLVAAAVIAGAAAARADSKGIAGFAGDKMKTCGDCHAGGQVMPSAFFGGPQAMMGGQTYDLAFNLSQGAPQLFGGLAIAASDGVLSVTTDKFAPRTQVLAGEIVHAVVAGPDSPIVFKFRLTAPSPQKAETVTLYGCAVSADGDGTPMGDRTACAMRMVTVFPPLPDMAVHYDYAMAPYDGLPDNLIIPDGLQYPDLTGFGPRPDGAACTGECPDAGDVKLDQALSKMMNPGMNGGCSCGVEGGANKGAGIPAMTLFFVSLLFWLRRRRLARGAGCAHAGD